MFTLTQHSESTIPPIREDVNVIYRMILTRPMNGVGTLSVNIILDFSTLMVTSPIMTVLIFPDH